MRNGLGWNQPASTRQSPHTTTDGPHLLRHRWQPPHRPAKPWRRVRETAGLEGVRIHDLRHTFASGGLLVGEGLPMIGKLLGHTQIQTTACYAHLADDPIKAAATRISGRLAAALGNPEGS